MTAVALDAAVLVVDDEEGTRTAVARALEPMGCAVRLAASAEEATARMAAEAFDVVLCDIRMTGMDGLEFQRRTREQHPDVPVVMITAYAAVDTAVRALKQGAYDYVAKPFSGEEVRSAVRRALESRRLRLENDSLRQMVRGGREQPYVGESVAIRRVYEQVATVAPSNAAVFISGESGSGKEIVARAIHEYSARARKMFVPLNCAAVPETLADSHLFGHVRGAFTGADSDRRGCIETASGGTLFLDEIADLKPDVQAKLLRVLEDGKQRRVGAEQEIPVDVRVLAAAQKPPEQLVRENRLRADLFYRLGSIHIHIPPLRERGADVEGLVMFFLRRFSEEIKKPVQGITPEALAALRKYSWPGNVRELRNVIERAAIFVRPGERVDLPELPEKLRHAVGGAPFIVADSPPPTLREMNARYAAHVLELCDRNKAKAARLLGVSPTTLWRHERDAAGAGSTSTSASASAENHA
ncbi:MAG: sigma-54-dependent Fis family transcriptional regulator [Planctomycetes bacterium]|nr:sigma-54-dependent Fis family transcriptional regulator [Planctomycetota bacterium]